MFLGSVYGLILQGNRLADVLSMEDELKKLLQMPSRIDALSMRLHRSEVKEATAGNPDTSYRSG